MIIFSTNNCLFIKNSGNGTVKNILLLKYNEK